LQPQLFVCLLLHSDALIPSLAEILSDDRYVVSWHHSMDRFFAFVEQEKQQLDCLILQENYDLLKVTHRLHRQITLLPAVILTDEKETIVANGASPHSSADDIETTQTLINQGQDNFNSTYHAAEVQLPITKLSQIALAIEQAIEQFLNLSPACRTNSSSNIDLVTDLTTQNFLLLQQRRLTEKLKERLGYLGVYYRRNPKNFFRHLPHPQQQELLTQLKLDYRDIVLTYFAQDSDSNQRIDEFVNTAFFADIPVSQIVEIHMDLIDEFSKQLKLEGRSEEILLDYRLTLIDVIAHLCEMYRRSIPKET
jgi:circadian clock protein KaiA